MLLITADTLSNTHLALAAGRLRRAAGPVIVRGLAAAALGAAVHRAVARRAVVVAAVQITRALRIVVAVALIVLLIAADLNSYQNTSPVRGRTG